MKRAGILALCACGVAAAVVALQASTGGSMRDDVASITRDEVALVPPRSADGARSLESGPLSGSAPGTARNDASAGALDSPVTAEDVTQTPAPGDATNVTGYILLAKSVLDEEGYEDYAYSPLPLSGRGRVRLVPMGPLNGRELLELPLPVDAPFAGWPDLRGSYTVDVFEPGYAPSDSPISTGDDGPWFECVTTPAPAIELDVRLPDGSQPPHAFLTFVPRDWTDARHGEARHDIRSIHGPHDHRREYFIWTPEDPRMGLQVADDDVVMDFLVLAEPCGESQYHALAACRHYSGVVRHDPAVTAPVRVQLHEAAHVSVQVAFPEALVIEAEPWVRAVRLDGLGEHDPAALLASEKWPEALFGRDDFDGLWNPSSLESDEPIEVRYLLPGLWRFAAGWGAEPPTAVQDVDIALGMNHVALQLGQPVTADHVPVRLSVEGAGARRLSASDQRVVFTAEPAKIVSSGIELVRGSGGQLWLPRSTLEALLAEAEGVRPVYFASVLGGSRIRIGDLSGPLDAAMPELVLTEVPAARVLLCAQHAGSGAFNLTVHTTLIEPLGEDMSLMRIAADRGLEMEWCHVEFGPAVRRAPMPGGLLPGRWRFSFGVSSAPLLAIAPVELELAPGQNEVTVVVPDLFDVTVHAPSLEKGARIRLRPESGPMGATSTRPSKDYAALDAQHRAVFNGLPAGHYVITHGASHAPQTIVVPCGEVLYEPRRSDAFEVHLAPLDSGGQGALARAGFQTGDILLDFNGRGLREHDDLDALVQVIAENEATVRLRRGAHTLELRLGPMPDPGDPWATFDAEFVPAWR